MGVGQAVDAREQGVAYPWVCFGTDADQADEERQYPDVAASSDQEAFVVSFREPSEQ
jgi:hypothetical protein